MTVLAHHRRSPGYNERYYICRNTQKHFTSFNVLIQYNKHIGRDELFHALRQVVLKQPTLACNFFRLYGEDEEENGHNYQVRFVNSIDFDDVVTYRAVEKVDGALFEELNDITFAMNTEKALWRLFVLELPSRKQILCACFEHSLADGLSGIQFHKQLTAALDAPQKDSSEYIFRYDPDQIGGPAISPAVENLTDLFVTSIWFRSMYFFRKTMFYEIITRSFQFLYRMLFSTEFYHSPGVHPMYSHQPVQHSLKSKYKVLNFTPAQVTKILAFCRTQGITMTPFFNAIGLRLMENTIYKEGIFASKTIIAVNGRRFYRQFDNNFPFGVLLGGIVIPLPPIQTDNKETLTRLMRHIHNISQIEINRRHIFKVVGMYDFFNHWHRFKSVFNKTQTRYPLLISNLGMVSTDTSDWVFEQAYFALNTSTAYQVIFDMVSTPEGGLNLVCVYIPEFHEKTIVAAHGKPVKAMDELVRQVHQVALSFIGD